MVTQEKVSRVMNCTSLNDISTVVVNSVMKSEVLELHLFTLKSRIVIPE